MENPSNQDFLLVRYDSIKDFRNIKLTYSTIILLGLGPVYISAKCRVARTDLRQLISWGGGELVNTARVAAVVVGEFCHVGDSNSPHFVADKWILDSVQHNMIMPFLDYPLE